MIPHAAGRELLLLVLLLFAGSFPFARQMSLLEWSQKSETERDRNRGNRSLFGGGVLVLVGLNPGQLMPDHLISPNRWAYLLAGLICLLIGLNYRGSGLSRWLGAGAPTPGKDDFPAFPPVSAPMRRGALKAKVEPLVAIVAAVRSGAQVIQTSPLAEPTSQTDAGLQRNDAAEFEFRQPEPLPEVASEDSYRAAYRGFRPLFLVLGLGLRSMPRISGRNIWCMTVMVAS
jgi:hypothetical protein